MQDRYEQMSLFGKDEAVCCADGTALPVRDPDAWMLKLVPDGEHVVFVGEKPFVLRPAHKDRVAESERYFHYAVGEKIYSGVFVG